MPGMPDREIGVRLLMDYEIDDARLEAHKYWAARGKKQGIGIKDLVDVDPDALDQEYMRQAVWRAFVDPDSSPDRPAPFVETIEDVRRMDSVIIRQLWNVYHDHLDSMDPRLKLEDAQLEEVIEQLKKERGAETILAQYAPDTLASLLRIMASQPES